MGAIAAAESPAGLGSLIGLPGLMGSRPRCGSAPVYVEVEIEVVCHVAMSDAKLPPAPGSKCA
jgi:hypothetical protein